MSELLPRSTFLKIPVIAAPPDDVVSHIIDIASESPSTGHRVHLLAGHSVVMAHEEPAFLELLTSDGLVIPDGRWLELLTRKAPVPLRQLRGHDLLQQVCDRGRGRKLRHYFFVSSDRVGDALVHAVTARYPGIEVVGVSAYPYGELSESERSAVAKAVVESRADVVWMGISSPRQDKESVWLSSQTMTTVVCVGAALEFEAGVQRSAPLWVQRSGFEWFYRLLREPRRLLRRYTAGSWAFVWLVLRDRLTRGSS